MPMKLWSYPPNYAGAEWYGYYVFLGRHRDSDELAESNFDVALDHLGGEDGEKVVVVRENHWAVGWVEWIGIHQTAKELVEKANEMLDYIVECYPVLDEQHYSQLQYDNLIEYLNSRFDDDSEKVRRYLDELSDSRGFTVDEADEDLIDAINQEEDYEEEDEE